MIEHLETLTDDGVSAVEGHEALARGWKAFKNNPEFWYVDQFCFVSSRYVPPSPK